MTNAKHEAPAEGAGEYVAKLIYEAMKWAAEHAGNDNIPAWVEGGNSFAQDQARSFIPPIVAALRARSSAPEAREEAQPVISAGRVLADALRQYGFPVSGGAKAALSDHGSAEALALNEACVAFLAALQAEQGAK